MLSIILPVYKRSDYTEQTLKSVCEQAKGKFELIVCVDGEDDKTYKKTHQFYNTYFGDMKVIAPHAKIGVNALRNMGIENAKYDHILVINDDILLSEGFDQAILKGLQEYDCVSPMYTESMNAFAGVPKRKRTNINGHCRAIRRKIWSEIGPIPKTLNLRYGDDRIYRRLTDLKRNVLWTDQCIVHHFRSVTVLDPANKQWIDELIEQDATAWQEILKSHSRFDERFSHLFSKK